jgi:hypothetical protein
MPPKNWEVAERISDRIVELVNKELDAMKAANRIEPLQLLAGQFLAIMALSGTIAPSVPDSLHHAVRAIRLCLQDITKEP